MGFLGSIKCENCGTELDADVSRKICPRCGHDVRQQLKKHYTFVRPFTAVGAGYIGGLMFTGSQILSFVIAAITGIGWWYVMEQEKSASSDDDSSSS